MIHVTQNQINSENSDPYCGTDNMSHKSWKLRATLMWPLDYSFSRSRHIRSSHYHGTLTHFTTPIQASFSSSGNEHCILDAFMRHRVTLNRRVAKINFFSMRVLPLIASTKKRKYTFLRARERKTVDLRLKCWIAPEISIRLRISQMLYPLFHRILSFLQKWGIIAMHLATDSSAILQLQKFKSSLS